MRTVRPPPSFIPTLILFLLMKSVHTLVQRVSAGTAIVNNIILVLLIQFKSHRKVGKYKYLMIYISIFEMFYAVIDALTVPDIFSKESSYFVLVQADQSFLPPHLMLWADVMFCVCFGISMALFGIHFIYRYLVLSEHWILKKYDREVIISLLLIPVLFGCFWFWVTYYFISPYDKANQFLFENLLEKNFMNISDVTYVGPYFWPKGVDGEKFLHMKSFYGIVIMTVAILVSFSLVFFFGIKCYKVTTELLQSATQSASFASLQSQLFYALVFQTLIPVLLMHIPASIGFLSAFCNVTSEPIGRFAAFTICLYPSLDPLPNFFIIKNYRDALLDFPRQVKLKMLCQKDTRVGVEANASAMYSVQSRASATAMN